MANFKFASDSMKIQIRLHHSVLSALAKVSPYIEASWAKHLSNGVVAAMGSINQNDAVLEAASVGMAHIEKVKGIPVVYQEFYEEFRERPLVIRMDKGFLEYADRVGTCVGLTKSSTIALGAFIGVRLLAQKFKVRL